jgi:hypothetical protein
MEDLGVDGKIMLEWILGKYIGNSESKSNLLFSLFCRRCTRTIFRCNPLTSPNICHSGSHL